MDKSILFCFLTKIRAAVRVSHLSYCPFLVSILLKKLCCLQNYLQDIKLENVVQALLNSKWFKLQFWHVTLIVFMMFTNKLSAIWLDALEFQGIACKHWLNPTMGRWEYTWLANSKMTMQTVDFNQTIRVSIRYFKVVV